MFLVFGINFPFPAGFQGKLGFSFGKNGFSFWFQFLPIREGVGVYLPPLRMAQNRGEKIIMLLWMMV